MAFALNREFGTGDNLRKIEACLKNFGLNPSRFERDDFIEAISSTYGISQEDAGNFFAKVLNVGAIRTISTQPSIPVTTPSEPKSTIPKGILDFSGLEPAPEPIRFEGLDPLPLE